MKTALLAALLFAAVPSARAACKSDAQCGRNLWCDAGACRQKKALGEACSKEDGARECLAAACSRGLCGCRSDADCAEDRWCDVDLSSNVCRPKLRLGVKCGSAGSVNNDRKCLSGTCSGFPNYVCKR